MSFKCCGYLNAKSLTKGGDCAGDYAEWFSNPVLSVQRPLVDAVYRSIQYRGGAPVLIVCDVAPERILLFRFTMESQDLQGRLHQRCEVMQVERSRLSSLLDGEFMAVPDAELGVFAVDAAGHDPLPLCESRIVHGVKIDLYSRDAKSFWFKRESSSISSPAQHIICDPQPDKRDSHIEEKPVKERGFMHKVLFLLLIATVSFGGWYCYQSLEKIDQLRKQLNASNDEVFKCRSEIKILEGENRRLLEEKKRVEKWVKNRGNFELNKIQLKIKLDEIVAKSREAGELMSHIDETPKSENSRAVTPNADGKMVSSSVSPVKKGGAVDGSSAENEEKRGKGIFDAIGDLLPRAEKP